jgi:hypothetical protein
MWCGHSKMVRSRVFLSVLIMQCCSSNTFALGLAQEIVDHFWQEKIKTPCVQFLKSGLCTDLKFGFVGVLIGCACGMGRNVGRKTPAFTLVFDMYLGGLVFGTIGFEWSRRSRFKKMNNEKIRDLNEQITALHEEINEERARAKDFARKLSDAKACLIQVDLREQETILLFSQKEKAINSQLEAFQKKQKERDNQCFALIDTIIQNH